MHQLPKTCADDRNNGVGFQAVSVCVCARVPLCVRVCCMVPCTSMCCCCCCGCYWYLPLYPFTAPADVPAARSIISASIHEYECLRVRDDPWPRISRRLPSLAGTHNSSATRIRASTSNMLGAWSQATGLQLASSPQHLCNTETASIPRFLTTYCLRLLVLLVCSNSAPSEAGTILGNEDPFSRSCLVQCPTSSNRLEMRRLRDSNTRKEHALHLGRSSARVHPVPPSSLVPRDAHRQLPPSCAR